MATPGPKPALPRYVVILRRVALTVAKLVVFGFLFGWAYEWAAPRFYGPERAPTFQIGVLHGALMPVALPVLFVGKDVPIYLPSPPNRLYKLGYIVGVNLCGVVFFGAAFRTARKPGDVA